MNPDPTRSAPHLARWESRFSVSSFRARWADVTWATTDRNEHVNRDANNIKRTVATFSR